MSAKSAKTSGNEKGSKLVSAAILLTLMLTFTYLSVRLFYFIFIPFVWYERLLSLLLLSAEMFGWMHSFGYFMSILTVIQRKGELLANKAPPVLKSYPLVAIVVPSYKEPLHVLHDTLICFYNLSYPNKQIYFLDDTRYDRPWDTPEKVAAYRQGVEELSAWIGVNLFRRKWRGAKAGIINDFLKFLEGEPLENLQYYPYQNENQIEKPKYLIVFDADMNPLPDFVETLVAYMEDNPKAAFIQTPQYYTNFENNRVARAAGLQQVIFFEYICEAKGMRNSMFCCGSNVLLRREALLAVGGFDDSSVTEDFATSLKMHLSGWQTLYYNKVCAFGMGPEDLGAYFKQQFRWAIGTLSLGRSLIFRFLANRQYFSWITFWEYWLSSTHYLVGWVFFVLLLFPILFLFFSVPSYFMDPAVYTALFFPYLIISLYTTAWTLYKRNFTPIHLLNSMLINAAGFPVFMKAAFYAAFGIHSGFTVTPKEQGEIMPLRDLWPQVLVLLLCASAITWGCDRIYYEAEPLYALITNIAWCFYNFIMLSSIFYFNSNL